MIDITYSGHNNKLTRKSCEILMIRGMKSCGDGKYTFSRDNRVKVNFLFIILFLLRIDLYPRVELLNIFFHYFIHMN